MMHDSDALGPRIDMDTVSYHHSVSIGKHMFNLPRAKRGRERARMSKKTLT
jgi:hypothetical protein